MAKSINNMKDLEKALQPVLLGMVDELAERVYQTLNYFLQEYYNSYNPKSYRRQYDFLRSAVKTKAKVKGNKVVASVYIDTDAMDVYMAIKKKEFADRMAENGGTTKKAAYKAVDAFIETLMDYLSEGEKVMLKGFGRFEMRTAKERIGRNPNTKEEYIIPEHEKVKFVTSEGLADRIKERRRTGTDENE